MEIEGVDLLMKISITNILDMSILIEVHIKGMIAINSLSILRNAMRICEVLVGKFVKYLS